MELSPRAAELTSLINRVRHFCYSFLLLRTSIMCFYYICLKLEKIELFETKCYRVGGSLGRHTFTSFLMKGFPGSLTLSFLLIVGAVMSAETDFGKMMMAPSGASSSEDPNWTEALRSSKGQGETSERESTGTSSSINLQKERARPAPAPNEVASPAPVVPFPYQEDEIIGGDSVESIQRAAFEFEEKNPSFCRGHTSYNRPELKPKTYSRSRSLFSGSCLALIQKEIGWDGELGPSRIRVPPRESIPWRNSIPFFRISNRGESIPSPSLN